MVLKFSQNRLPRKATENCRFLKRAERECGDHKRVYMLCRARPFDKKPDQRGIIRPWKKTGENGEGYFERDPELAYKFCSNYFCGGRCPFRYKFPKKLIFASVR